LKKQLVSRDYLVIVKKTLTETHIIIRLFLLLSLLLLSGSISGSGTSGTSSNSGTSTRGTNVQEKGLEVLTSESLGVEREPDRFNFNTGSGNKGLELVSLYIKTSVPLIQFFTKCYN
jgi:hypothetical protein